MEKQQIIRRLVLEQFGYIDVPIELDLTLGPEEVYQEASRIERNLNAYKQAFWDMMKEQKAEREANKAKLTKAQEVQKVEDRKQLIVDLIANEPDAVKEKMDEFGGLLDESAAAALILKGREVPKEPASGGPRKDAPKLPDTATFFKSKYGWSLYTDPANIDEILAWLISIPKEERGRKTAEPKKSNNGKAIYVNDKEKAIYAAEANNQGKRAHVKED